VVAQETAVAQARLLLPPLEKALDQQRNLLAVLTGQFPSESAAASFRLGAFRLPRKLPLSLPADLDYAGLGGLSNEVREKLAAVRPATLGQAARIEGVTPGALTALLAHVRRRRAA